MNNLSKNCHSKEPVIETICGIKVTDSFRWLERGDDPQVKAWIDEQNNKTISDFKDDFFEVFSNELAKNYKVINYTNPIPVNGNYFYIERHTGEDQAVLYMKKGLDGEPVKLFDPNGKIDGNTISIDFWSVSKTGKYIAYGISEGGNEMSTLLIKNTETNSDLSEKIPQCRHSCIRWMPDDTAFFYTRNPRQGTVPKNEESLHSKVYLHRLGDNPDNDELIFGEGRSKDDMISIAISLDGRYLSISATQNWTENDIYIYDRETKVTKPLITGIHALFYLNFLQDKILLNTNYKANNFRILFTTYDNLFKHIDEWKEFVKEKESVLESYFVTKSKILVEYLVDACSKVIEIDYQGRMVGEIPIPKYSSLVGISCRKEEEEFFFSFESYTFPRIITRYDPMTLSYCEYRKVKNLVEPSNYEVKQEWYISKDGTKVPMFIFHKKGLELNGQNPTILYGYGGFGNSETPSYMRNWIPWVERGGIFAIANIRGGGEFGDDWHKAGVAENKQNCFDDFISAGEYLIAQKYTSKEFFGIIGGSNGGLLVTAVAVQRPDLFSAVCSRVPITDMVRFPKFGMAVRWIHEYGNPENKEDLIRILKWSPYHNVKRGVKYPDFFFATANKDNRVDPLHARKMFALLQNSNKDNNVHIFTEMEAGHGSGKPVSKIVELQAYILSFFFSRLNSKA